MTNGEFEPGSAELKDFFWWINERHSIWIQRSNGCPKPWTEDPVMQRYKFTNVFRELDRGTLALKAMLKGHKSTRQARSKDLLLFNVIWYRMFNRFEHGKDIGFCKTFEDMADAIRDKRMRGDKIFTSAHLTWGGAGSGMGKVDATLNTLAQIYDDIDTLTADIRRGKTLEHAFTLLKRYKGIGRFISYEIVSDLRWLKGLLLRAPDVLTWANIGPGCKRGLRRLGLPETIDSLHLLYYIAENHLPLAGEPMPRSMEEYNELDCGLKVQQAIACGRMTGPSCVVPSLDSHVIHHHTGWARFNEIAAHEPRFELREIEHSLCEFDKWQRVSKGQGQTRSRFNGT